MLRLKISGGRQSCSSADALPSVGSPRSQRQSDRSCWDR
jgi:hypothetical protein